MIPIKTTDELAEYIIKRLKDENITIHYYHSMTSNSIYLKLDYGACNSIRISDHDKNKDEYHYKYELRTDKELSWKRFEDNQYMIRYPEKQIDNLIDEIIKDKENKIKVKGLHKYKKEMDKRAEYMKSDKSKKFYKLCMEVLECNEREKCISVIENKRFSDNQS